MSDLQLTHKVNGNSYRAWGDALPDGSAHWMLATDDPISVFAEVVVKVERHRRQDMSGMKEFRVVTKTHCEIIYRIGYKKEVTLQDNYFFYVGEKTAVRELIKMMTADNWHVIVEMDMETQCRKAGIDERRIFNARFDFNGWNEDGLLGCRNLYNLLQEQNNQ